jgi:cation diffusion facilitator CzcD-associated flavoprotein CzcO
MAPVKRVAVIGLGPGGAITIDALAKEKTFDVIRVFERREAAGGCWFVRLYLIQTGVLQVVVMICIPF